MLSEWSAECSADDPVLVVPWSDPSDASRRFVDLRENPYDLDHLPEAERYPPLMHALRALNAARSPVFTAKSDAWPLDPDELEALHIHIGVEANEAPAGFASYIDLLAATAPSSLPFIFRSSCCAASPATPNHSIIPTPCSTASSVQP